nr:MAG TPA: hypothetical protein [Caudoviricetes sp.]
MIKSKPLKYDFMFFTVISISIYLNIWIANKTLSIQI